MKIKKIAINEITPYWRNPRENHKAVVKVKQSIEQYGYNQLIAVDKDNVIVAGHTRFLALKELGYTNVQVMQLDLPLEKAKEYRLVDNITNEYSNWNEDLLTELKEISIEVVEDYFGVNILNDIEKSLGVDMKEITDIEIERMNAVINEPPQGSGTPDTTVICPKCLHEFQVRG